MSGTGTSVENGFSCEDRFILLLGTFVNEYMCKGSSVRSLRCHNRL